MANLKELINNYKATTQEEISSLNKISTKQTPKLLILTCSDSRVDPAIILKAKLGEIFVIRNVANSTESQETINAFKFGIENLNIKDIVIMGHSNCGGVRAKHENINENENEIKKYEIQNLKASYENLLNNDWIKTNFDNKLINIHLWYFSLKNYKLYELNPKTNETNLT